MERAADNESTEKSSCKVVRSAFPIYQSSRLRTICDCGMSPGHPFARESEHNVAVLEFGWHCNSIIKSHPKECHPKDPEEMDLESKRLMRMKLLDV
jgi:hypothetical protein